MKERAEKKTGGMEPIPPELVAQAMAGDQAAFTELYERTSAMLYRTIRSMVRDEDLVWDIQQDSYLRAWSGISELQAPEAFLPWLRRIAVNTATNALNKRTPLNFTDLSDLDDEEGWGAELPDLREDAQPELVLDRKETSRLVREILNKLPREQQLIVGMYYSEEMPIKEIAETLHVTPGTVKTQLHRGRKRIETEVRALEQQGVKLYGLSPIPFLLALLRKLEPAPRAEKKVLAAVLAEAPQAVGAAGGAATGSTAVAVTAMTTKRVFLRGLAVRLLAFTLAAALIVGGKLIYDALKERELSMIGDEQPTTEAAFTPTDSVTPSTLPAPDSASVNVCGNNLTWRFNEDSGALIIEGSGDMYNYDPFNHAPWYDQREALVTVVLSDEVTSIGEYAFYENTSLASITLPDSVASIGKSAFSGCDSLESVTLSEGLTDIGERAFSFCKQLRSVSIPEHVRSIEQDAFISCSNLSRFSVDPNNQSFSADENGFLYSKDQTTLIACPTSIAGSCGIPEGVTAIGPYAFYNCRAMESVTLPDSLTSIGEEAFSWCTGLTFLELPPNLTHIGENAFEYSGLTTAVLPASLTEFQSSAFNTCEELTAFIVDPNSQTFSTDENGLLYNKEKSLLLACPVGRSGTIVIPDGVTAIGDYAFYYRFRMTDVKIPDSVCTIGKHAFSNCDSLRFIDLPEGITSIGRYAFSSCSALEAVELPEGISTIEDHLFYRCMGLRSVTIPESVTAIGNSAFENCDSLISLTIPERVTSIGLCAFRYCDSLTSLTIPEGVTAIENYAFSGCSSLTSVTIPESVTGIGFDVFSGCDALTIFCASGSDAEQYANNNRIHYEVLP